MAGTPKARADAFANVAALSITESGANTFTSTKFSFPFSIMDKMALILNRVEYEIANPVQVLAAVDDQLFMGLSAASTISDVTNVADPLIIDELKALRWDAGTAASGSFLVTPIVRDFSNLPGGGLLVAPNPFYGWVKGYQASAAAQVRFRVWYTYVELNTDEYWQLVESRRIISS